MKSLWIILLIPLLLSSCTKKQESPNDLLLKIKNYSCSMKIDILSNKNSTSYTAKQKYNSSGDSELEFLDDENLKISYKDKKLSISSLPLETSLTLEDYENINQNPLFLSYFINCYFNSENNDTIKTTKDKIALVLPELNSYLHHAELLFKKNKPSRLTYYDANGTTRVNIIYNEFESSSA